MLDHEHNLKFFLENTYPCVIVHDRYSGSYSGGLWTAFMSDEVPEGSQSGDMECSQFWDAYDEPVGKGSTPEEALTELICAVQRRMVSDEERRIEASDNGA